MRRNWRAARSSQVFKCNASLPPSPSSTSNPFQLGVARACVVEKEEALKRAVRIARSALKRAKLVVITQRVARALGLKGRNDVVAKHRAKTRAAAN